MKIYIAGKITGDPDYRAKFADAQRQIEAQGHIVLNPATLPEGMEPKDYMRICFAMIDAADELWELPTASATYVNVRGAYRDPTGEIELCCSCGMRIREWLKPTEEGKKDG